MSRHGAKLRGALPSALIVSLLLLSPLKAAAQEKTFQTENDAAMARMMTGMAIKPSGDVDRDFAEMMIAHHQGAIDMAQAELRHGGNEQLRRIAQEIIVDQLQEISAMRSALGDPLPPPAAAPTQPRRPAAAPSPPEPRR